jgi:membrane-associated phospholipid phosphatase
VARFTLPWAVRAWLPHAYIVLGYWVPAAFTPVPRDGRFERWLAHADACLWGQARAWHVPDPNLTPAWHRSGTRGFLELAYLLCYPLVPAAFTVVYFRGDSCAVERFWMAVLMAAYACYGTLRWTAARPPRLAMRHVPDGLFASLNAFVLGRVSHRLNTFPSGHVAMSIATAIAVGRVSVEAGALSGALAMAIAVAAVAGRYHYLVDVVLGLLLGVAAGAGAPALTGSMPCG